MANVEHVSVLLTDVDDWNRWRGENPDFQPELSRSNLHGAKLMLADLRHAVLNGADLRLADLKGVDLRWADLRGANLVGARLIGADLEGADLRGADLRTAEDLTTEQLELTIGDDTTLLPDETMRPRRWSSLADAR